MDEPLGPGFFRNRQILLAEMMRTHRDAIPQETMAGFERVLPGVMCKDGPEVICQCGRKAIRFATVTLQFSSSTDTKYRLVDQCWHEDVAYPFALPCSFVGKVRVYPP